MKTSIKLALLLFAVLILCIVIYGFISYFNNLPEQSGELNRQEPITTAAHEAVPRYVSAVYIAPEWTSGASEQEWKDALKNMRDIGIDTVIVQYTFQIDSRYGTQAYFDYWQQDTVGNADEHPMRRSQIAYILEAAKSQGIQVYLGLQVADEDWFSEDKYKDYDWLYSQHWLSTDLAGSLWSAFGEAYGDIIAGWYLPFEFESTTEYYPYFEQITNVYYNNVTTYLKNDARFGNLPIMIAPRMLQDDDKNAWQENLKILLSGSAIDIIAPQNGIAFGLQSPETVGDWYRATRDVVDHVNNAYVNKNVSLWATCENFILKRNPEEPDHLEEVKPMAIGKFIDTLDIAAPYVDRLIAFSIHRLDVTMTTYYSNYLGINESYYEAYKRYYNTGVRAASISDGYYVSIQSTGDEPLIFNADANACLTDGFASDTGNWNEYKGISSPQNQPFTMEIRFDDPTSIGSISAHYFQDSQSAIALPEQVKYEYLIRSGDKYEIFDYTFIAANQPSGTGQQLLSMVNLESPVTVDGVRITVIPGGEWTFIDDIMILPS